MPYSGQLLEAKEKGTDVGSSILRGHNNLEILKRLSENKRKMTFLHDPCFMLNVAMSCFRLIK